MLIAAIGIVTGTRLARKGPEFWTAFTLQWARRHGSAILVAERIKAGTIVRKSVRQSSCPDCR